MTSLPNQLLHHAYSPQRYDPIRVWAGNLSVCTEGEWHSPVLTRLHLQEGERRTVCVRAELYLADVDPGGVAQSIDARVWSDVNDRGDLDDRGVYQPGGGNFVAATAVEGRIGCSPNHILFESVPIEVTRTGVYHATYYFFVDGKSASDP